MMEHDEQLASSIRMLLLISLQRKVGALLVNRTCEDTDASISPFVASQYSPAYAVPLQGQRTVRAPSTKTTAPMDYASSD